MEDRIYYIDFLKFIGLTGIILAHVGPPNAVMMVRGFDVPLMVILSAILAQRSYHKRVSGTFSIGSYYISRIKRLVIPTWIFLILYFTLYLLAGGRFQGVSFYIASFCLTLYGLPYVWIILIYLYSAMLVPLFHKIPLSKIGLILLGAVYLTYEIAYHYQIGTQYPWIMTTVYYIIPYGILTYLGFNYHAMKPNMKYAVMIASGAVFVILFAYYWRTTGTPQTTNIAKYPARLYYLSYGVACSFALLRLCEKHPLKIYQNPIIRFVSTHSLWIYLWHGFILLIYPKLHMPEIWYIKMAIVYLAACILVIAVNRCLDWIEKKRKFAILQFLRG